MKEISKGVYKFGRSSNIYYIKHLSLIIDTGDKEDGLVTDINKILVPETIKTVVFTHLHYDHIQHASLFTQAWLLASGQELTDLKSSSYATTLSEDVTESFVKRIRPLSAKDIGPDMQIINCPGHTRGSISLYYTAERILFSGDTLFAKGIYGRTDLPTSAPEKMNETLNMLENLNYRTLCPGHDY